MIAAQLFTVLDLERSERGKVGNGIGSSRSPVMSGSGHFNS